VEGSAGNRVNVRESVIEATRNKVRQLADEGRTVEQIDRALAGEGLTEQERDVAYLLATYEVGRGSAPRKGAPGYWGDVEREIGG
jgi:DNA repair ATPase RecN